ncbi:MAG: hypothetical protein JJT88_11000 [Gammaproteobacteria bacterium]|jgi:hypothetical protein|nr:hypothetical protein [Gammaproteobacteria bacterium]
MKSLKSIWAAAAVFIAGCGGPVPSDMFLTMSVSTLDTAVETILNGKANDSLSSQSVSMTASLPLNRLVHEGENEIVFLLSPSPNVNMSRIRPAFLASLEINVKGEIVDTLAPGARTLFSRELTEAETATIAAGETVTITQAFTVDRDALEAIKSGSTR